MTDQQRYHPLLVDDHTYSSKIGLTCAQHENLDCQAFIDVGFSAEEVNELVSRCPQSCSANDKQQRSLQYQNSRVTLGQDDSIGKECLNPGWENDSCRDDPGFLADALLLPCESFQLLECKKLDAIGLNEEQVHTIINACPCSCDIPCGTWTMSPTTEPTSTPTISPQPTTAMPTARPTAMPTANPTRQPSRSPTRSPTTYPTNSPTQRPTKQPSASPTIAPTKAPSSSPTFSPTVTPTKAPTLSKAPTIRPTPPPSKSPTPFPTTASPTISMEPSSSPSVTPSLAPSISAMPTTSDYWAAATVWQENKQTFQGLIVIFGAVGVALLGLGIITLYRMKKSSRAKDTRGKLLQGMGYTSGPSGRDITSPKNEHGKRERTATKKDNRGKDRGSSKGRVKFVEPNVRSNNASVPAAIYDQSLPEQRPVALSHPLDGVVDIEADPEVGWLDQYALRHQPPKAQVVVPNYSDDYATLGTARSSSSTLNTKTTKGTAISKVLVSQKSNDSRGSIVVFEHSKPSVQPDAPNIDEKKEKRKNDILLKALPFAGRDRTCSTKASSTADFPTSPTEEDLVVSEPMKNKKLNTGGSEKQAHVQTMQYVLPPPERKYDEESGKIVKKKDGRFILRWPIARKTEGSVATKPREEPIGLIERPQRASPSPQPENSRRKPTSRPTVNDEPPTRGSGTLHAEDTNHRQKMSAVHPTRETPAVHSPQVAQADTGVHTSKPTTWSERGAWLPTAMFASPRPDVKPEDDREPVVTTAPATEQTQSTWKSWMPGDVQWINPMAATEAAPVVDLEQGNEQATAKSSQPDQNPGYFPSLPQVEWPAWMASTAAPSELSVARQQTSIISPTTEDGIGNNAGGDGAFAFEKVGRKGKVRSSKKWLKGKGTSRSVTSADPDANVQ